MHWLKVLFGVSFKDRGATLAIGKQGDGYSCGPCVLNAMEHAILNAPLFTHGSRHSLRAAYFVRLMQYLLRDVSALSPDPPEGCHLLTHLPTACRAAADADDTTTGNQSHWPRGQIASTPRTLLQGSAGFRISPRRPGIPEPELRWGEGNCE